MVLFGWVGQTKSLDIAREVPFPTGCHRFHIPHIFNLLARPFVQLFGKVGQSLFRFCPGNLGQSAIRQPRPISRPRIGSALRIRLMRQESAYLVRGRASVGQAGRTGLAQSMQ